METVKRKIQELCALDLRSLAAFRVGLALILLGDILIRLQDVGAHYSDEGVLPREVFIKSYAGAWNFSLNLINGSWQFQAMLFVFAALCAIALLVGYRTRLATVLSWILLVSVQNRNAIILQGGDGLLRLCLFWSMFLPLGAYWSWDSRKNVQAPGQTQVCSVASLALMLQVCFMYLFTSYLKIHPIWTSEGSAVWYALNIEQYATPIGTYLTQFPTLLKGLTFATLVLEAVGPILAFSPFLTGPMRFGVVIAFISFHLGLEVTMVLAHFPWVCIVAWIAFVPPWFWDRVFKTQMPRFALRASWPSNVVVGLLLTYVFLWNLKEHNLRPPYLPPWQIGSLLRLDQRWNMFAPFPYTNDGWVVIPGQLRNGREVDVYTEKDLTWERPPHLAYTYINDHWRSFLMNLYLEDYNRDIALLNYGKYLCRRWNTSHPQDEQLENFTINYMLQTNKFGSSRTEPRKRQLWQHWCFSKVAQKG